MKNQRKRINTKKLLYLIIALYVGYILFQQQMYLIACGKEENANLKQIEEQKKITQQLKSQEASYQSDWFIEKMAREKLGMVLPGERIFIDISK